MSDRFVRGARSWGRRTAFLLVAVAALSVWTSPGPGDAAVPRAIAVAEEVDRNEGFLAQVPDGARRDAESAEPARKENTDARIGLEDLTPEYAFQTRRLEHSSAPELGPLLDSLVELADDDRHWLKLRTRIEVDAQSNSLLIQASRERMAQILALIDALDTRPRQVLIEAQVFQLTDGDQYSVGVDFASIDAVADPNSPSYNDMRGGAITRYGIAPFTFDANKDVVLDPSKFSNGLSLFAFRGNFDKVPLFLNAFKGKRHSNLLAQPFALTNDNKSATFTDSDQTPILTTSAASGLPSLTTAGQTQSADTILEITPHISAANYVRLEIKLKLEDFTADANAAFGGARPKVSRQFSGEVTVPDNRYIVIGGMSRNNKRRTVNTIPLIGDLLEHIPIVNWFVSSRNVEQAESHIFVFIRPHIFTDRQFADVEAVTKQWQNQAAKLRGQNFPSSPPDQSIEYQQMKQQVRDLFEDVRSPNPYGK